jgi:predicted nucleic acid-binding protein
MIVVDSSVWIAALRGEVGAGVRKLANLVARAPEDILVGDLILLELLQGARNESHARFIEERFRLFSVAPMLDVDLAVSTARNFRTLRGRGVTLRKTADLIIATFCIEYGHGLLHQDRDFDPAERILGLRVL